MRFFSFKGIFWMGLVWAGVVGMGLERGAMGQSQVGFVIPNQSIENQPYNLKLGPVTLRMDGNVSAAFNDNVNVAKSGREADYSLTPAVGLHLLWQPTEFNTLNLDVSIGYQAYLEHPRNNGLILSNTSGSQSQLQYNIFVGEVKINLHDSFSYQQDPLPIGQLSNNAQFGRFQNDAGISANWALNDDVILTAGYDHTNFWVFESAYSYLDNGVDSISTQVAVTITPTLTAGFSTAVSNTQFDQNIQNNSTGVTFGPFVTSQLSENLSVHAAAGASLSNYSSGGLNGDTSTENYTYTASVGVTHRINDQLTESLTAGREVIPGLTSNYTDRVYANYGTSYQLTPSLNFGLSLWWENLQDSNAIFRQTSNRYGASLSTSYALTDRSTLSLSYQYVLKVANPSNLGYYQNLVTLGYAYQF
jgi:hypothetical protein